MAASARGPSPCPFSSRDDAPIFAPVRVDGTPNTAALAEEASAAGARLPITPDEDLRRGARGARGARAIARG